MNCLSENCENQVLTDYPMCLTHSPLRHFTNRTDCRCESCQNPNLFPAAVHARFPGLVLIARSDDPPELRRVEISLDAIKPEHRLEFARGVEELIKSAVKAAA